MTVLQGDIIADYRGFIISISQSSVGATHLIIFTVGGYWLKAKVCPRCNRMGNFIGVVILLVWAGLA